MEIANPKGKKLRNSPKLIVSLSVKKQSFYCCNLSVFNFVIPTHELEKTKYITIISIYD